MPHVTTEIIAHRGASRDAHENTLRAFIEALEQGADAIELDVHVTRDGVVVVHHDPVLAWPGGTPARAIASMRGAEVAEVCLISGDRIPTLDETLALVGPFATVYVEVKGAGIERAVAACLDRHPGTRTAVHSFDHRIPVRLRGLRPATPIGLLSTSYPLDPGYLVSEASADAMWQHWSMIDALFVQHAHQAGARVVAWTENDPIHARELIAMGVDALCTDTPGELRARLAG